MTTRIKNIAHGYYRDENRAEVKYAISLTDGRVVMVSVPVNMDVPRAVAVDYARPHAERYMFNFLKREHELQRFLCCKGMTHYGVKGHKATCPAFTVGGPLALQQEAR